MRFEKLARCLIGQASCVRYGPEQVQVVAVRFAAAQRAAAPVVPQRAANGTLTTQGIVFTWFWTYTSVTRGQVSIVLLTMDSASGFVLQSQKGGIRGFA